jgi:DNA polymerase-3 subunit beta
MKLTVERSALLKSLAHVQSVVERRNTIPILSNVLIEARDGALHLMATDMDLTVVETVPASVADAGDTTAPAHTLYDIVRKLPEGAEIQLSTDGAGQLALRAGRSRFSLPTLPKDDFPVAAAAQFPHEFSLAPGEAQAIIDRTAFAISTEETRYYLNGIYLHTPTQDDPKVLRAVATDGHRLARFEMPLPAGAGAMPGVIVPRKAVAELRRLLAEGEGRVDVALSDTRIRFTLGPIVLTSKLIDGTFPDYQRVIPTGHDKVAVVDKKAFTEAVDRVATISSEKSRAVKVALKANVMTVSATSPENGSASEELEVDYQGPPLEIGFNARYLLDITQQIQGDGARIELADAASPTLVRDGADASALYVLMPMRV